MRRLIWLLVAVAVLAAPASADMAGVDDAADTGDVMDLAHAAHGHGEHGVLIHTLSTHEAWTNEEFVGAHLRLWVDHRGGTTSRFVLVVAQNVDQTFSASIHRAGARFEPGRVVGYANAYRSDDRTLSLEVARATLGRRVAGYGWKAYLSYPCSRAEDVSCAPPPPDTHSGRVAHRLATGR